MVVLAFLVLWGLYKGLMALIRRVRTIPPELPPASIPAWHPETLPGGPSQQ